MFPFKGVFNRFPFFSGGIMGDICNWTCVNLLKYPYEKEFNANYKTDCGVVVKCIDSLPECRFCLKEINFVDE